MKELTNFLKDGGWILVITVIIAILFVIVLRKGMKDAKEIDDSCLGLSQGEIDIYKMYEEKRRNRSKEDKHLNELIDQWGKKKFGKQSIEEIVAMPDKKKASQMLIDRSENKRGFQNRSDVDSVDMEFMNTIH